MHVLGLAGWSGSGKTTLVERLVPALIAEGLSVSTIKHAHNHFDMDTPGKDSYRHRAAGATEVLVASRRRWALMHELRGQAEPSLAALLAHVSPVDLVLVEGFKDHPHPKLEVSRHANGKPPLHLDDGWIIAVAADGPVASARVPVLDLNDPVPIARFIVDHFGLVRRPAEVGGS